MNPVLPPNIQSLLPWDTLQEYINDWTKKIQELFDRLSGDPDADNSRNPYIPHTESNITFCMRTIAHYVTSAYDDWIHSNGNQPYLVMGTLNIEGTIPFITNFTVVGEMYSGDWYSVPDADKPAVDELMIAWWNNTNLSFTNLQPTRLIEMSSDYSDPYSYRYQLHPVGYGADKLTFDVTDHTQSTANVTPVTAWFYPLEFEDMGETSYGRLKPIGRNPGDIQNPYNGVFSCPYAQPCVMTVGTEAEAQDYVSKNDAVHNDVITYQGDGDEFKVYYGDNYIIYVIPDGDEVSYDDLYNVTVDATLDIDPTIHVPTYRENKYGPEPEPVTDDDYIDMGLGVETDGMAMYNMAVLTRDELVQLITDFETNADTGLSFLPHVLGLYKLGIESSQLLTTNSDTIKLHKEPGKSAFTSADNYDIVDTQLPVIDCGSITVDREELLTNTFLDYSPYSSYEMYIPGCGWITLPDTIVGRTISVHIVFDLTTCSCKGVVRSEGKLLGGGGSTLATVNGIIGSSVPLSINETGLQRGAIMSGAVQTVTALGTTAMGIGIGNPYMGMSGIAMAAGSLAETHIAGNATYTSTKGGATDYSIFGDGYKAVLKITRPKLEIPDNYGHTVGYVINKYDVLGNYSGFTVCLNPHITGLSCTSEEKDEIARLLERGVILPAGEE